MCIRIVTSNIRHPEERIISPEYKELSPHPSWNHEFRTAKPAIKAKILDVQRGPDSSAPILVFLEPIGNTLFTSLLKSPHNWVEYL